jgi:hypothetical protein
MGSLLVVGLIGTCARGDDRLDQLFTSWQEAQRDVKSLVVEFTLETWDPVFKERDKAEGAFRLLRTPKGEVFVSFEMTQKEVRVSALLNGGAVYLLDHGKKTALRIEFTEVELRQCLEQWFSPFGLLLDRKHAEDEYKLEIVKQDDSCTYLAMKPKQVKRSGWFAGVTVREARATLMNKASPEIPKDMPRQLWYSNGVSKSESTVNVKAWRLNAADVPKMEEFARPEDRPGWKVAEFSFRAKK